MNAVGGCPAGGLLLLCVGLCGCAVGASPGDTGGAATRQPVPTASPAPAASGGPGITGVVLRSPCPPAARQTCGAPPAPVAGVVAVHDRASNRLVGSARTDGLGRYRVAVPAGSYTVSVTPDGSGTRCAARDVTVAGSTVVEADLDCE